MSPLLRFTLGLFFLFNSIITHTSAVGSPAPTLCTIQVCPSTDDSGYDLGMAAQYHIYTSTNIFCSYPSNEGDDPQGFYCDYDPHSGILTTDHDFSGCPSTTDALQTTCSRKRSLERSMHAEEARLLKQRSITTGTKERQEQRRGLRRHRAVA